MIEQDKDKEFLQAIKSQLDQSIENIDGSTQSRLTQIRHLALDKVSTKSHPSILLPAGAFASACLVLAIVSYLPDQQTEQINVFDDIELISFSGSMDLYEDLEFYEWLEDYELPT